MVKKSLAAAESQKLIYEFPDKLKGIFHVKIFRIVKGKTYITKKICSPRYILEYGIKSFANILYKILAEDLSFLDI